MLPSGGSWRRKELVIVNPNKREYVQTVEGANNLVSTFDVVGLPFEDPQEVNQKRIWVVQDLYAPIPTRTLRGIRAKVVDPKGFVSFVNQRDLEVLLGRATERSFCQWLGQPYASTASNDWIGLAVDGDDSLDDLYDREVVLRRGRIQRPLDPKDTITRRLHREAGHDVIETWVLIADRDPVTGASPDIRRETIMNRWVLSETTRVSWASMT